MYPPLVLLVIYYLGVLCLHSRLVCPSLQVNRERYKGMRGETGERDFTGSRRRQGIGAHCSLYCPFEIANTLKLALE